MLFTSCHIGTTFRNILFSALFTPPVGLDSHRSSSADLGPPFRTERRLSFGTHVSKAASLLSLLERQGNRSIKITFSKDLFSHEQISVPETLFHISFVKWEKNYPWFFYEQITEPETMFHITFVKWESLRW